MENKIYHVKETLDAGNVNTVVKSHYDKAVEMAKNNAVNLFGVESGTGVLYGWNGTSFYNLEGTYQDLSQFNTPSEGTEQPLKTSEEEVEQSHETETTVPVSAEETVYTAEIKALNTEIEELKKALAESEEKRDFYVEITASIDKKIAECVENASSKLNEEISGLKNELENAQKKINDIGVRIDDISDIINQDAE